MVDVRQQNIASAIEALLLDDGGIDKIAVHLGGFNIFEAIGHTRSEERHSHFLAFLLDPNETHGLGTEFLTRFVVEIVKSMRPESRPLSLSEITLVDFEGCLVLRECHRIDVLCIDEAHRFLLAVENKVGSKERSDPAETISLISGGAVSGIPPRPRLPDSRERRGVRRKLDTGWLQRRSLSCRDPHQKAQRAPQRRRLHVLGSLCSHVAEKHRDRQ